MCRKIGVNCAKGFLKEIIMEWKDKTDERWIKPVEIKLCACLIHIWLIYLPNVLNEVCEFLSEDERLKLLSFKFNKERINSCRSRGVLRDLLGKYTSVRPKNIEFSYNSYGKPFLNFPAKEKIFFNVSHSKDYALMAFCLNTDLGVDIEYMQDIDYVDMSNRFFSRQEQIYLKNSPVPLQKSIFYKIWTKREALLKAAGTGFIDSPDVRAVSNSIKSRNLKHARALPEKNDVWKIYKFSPRPGYRAALVIKAGKNFDKKYFLYG